MMKYENDEWLTPNTRMERHMMDCKSHLFFKAVEDIEENSELRYYLNVVENFKWYRSKF